MSILFVFQRVCRCTFQCSEISTKQKKVLFNELHSKDYNQQQIMISDLVEVHDVRRHYRNSTVRTKSGCESRRKRTPWYFLWNDSGDRVRVCQGTICDALGISRVRLQALYKKKAAGLPIEDQRGKHHNRPTKGKRSAVLNMKRDHIKKPSEKMVDSNKAVHFTVTETPLSGNLTEDTLTLKELLNTTFGPQADALNTEGGRVVNKTNIISAISLNHRSEFPQDYMTPASCHQNVHIGSSASSLIPQAGEENGGRFPIPGVLGNRACHYLQPSSDNSWRYSTADDLCHFSSRHGGTHFPQRVPAVYGAHQNFSTVQDIPQCVGPWAAHSTYQQNPVQCHPDNMRAPGDQHHHQNMFNFEQGAFPLYSSSGSQTCFPSAHRSNTTSYISSVPGHPLNMTMGNLASIEVHGSSTNKHQISKQIVVSENYQKVRMYIYFCAD